MPGENWAPRIVLYLDVERVEGQKEGDIETADGKRRGSQEMASRLVGADYTDYKERSRQRV